MTTQLRADLLALQELLSAPERWTKGDAARAESGMAVDPCDWRAVSWCMLGGINHLFDGIRRVAVREYLYSKADYSLAQFNDESTHAEVMAFLQSTVDAVSEYL